MSASTIWMGETTAICSRIQRSPGSLSRLPGALALNLLLRRAASRGPLVRRAGGSIGLQLPRKEAREFLVG